MLFDKVEDVNAICGRKKLHTPTKLEQFLEDFERSGLPIGEVRWKADYHTAEGCRNSLNVAIRRLRKHHLKVATRGDRLFIFNILSSIKEIQ